MVYEGKENYIFVSYAHKDHKTVLPILDAMIADGFRVWYDSGIEAGTEWPEYIEERLLNAQVVLVFMTPATVESRNCRNEINFALELKKEVLVVYLEETTLLKGMRLQLNSSQSLFRKHHKSEAQFLRCLLDAPILQCCRIQPKAAPADPVVQAPAPVAPPARTSRWPIFAMLGAVLAALIILICMVAMKGGDGPDPTAPAQTIAPTTQTGSTGPTTQTEATAPTVPEPTLSDDLFDYTVQIDGTVFRLPCGFDELTAAGWTISSTDYHDGFKVKGGGTEHFTMTCNGRKLYVSAHNPGGNATEIRDCRIVGFSWDADYGIDGQLPKGISARSTADEIIAAYGEPAYRNDGSTYVSLSYQKKDAPQNEVKFMCYADGTSITVRNYPSRPGEGSVYQDGVTMSDDLFRHTIELEGTVIGLPCAYDTLSAAGWTISSAGYQDTYAVEGHGTDAFYMSLNGKRLQVSVHNPSPDPKAIKDCRVVSLTWDVRSNVDAKLAKGITARSSLEEILAAFGVPASRSDYSDAVSLTYRPDDSSGDLVRFYCYTDTDRTKLSYVTVTNKDTSNDGTTDTDTTRPAYLDSYVAPEALGSDYKMPILRLGGDLYRLPAPVTAFTDNGWRIIEQPHAIPAGNSGTIRLRREGLELKLSVFNHADYQTTPVNCAVQKIDVSAHHNVPLELPMDLDFSCTKAHVEEVVTDEFKASTSTSYESWYYSNNGFSLDIRTSTETQAMVRIIMTCQDWDY